jgi:hypothetical protein
LVSTFVWPLERSSRELGTGELEAISGGMRTFDGCRCSLPEHKTKEIEGNFVAIAEKTAVIGGRFNEANVKATVKTIVDRMRSFVTAEIVKEAKEIAEDSLENVKEPLEIPKDPPQIPKEPPKLTENDEDDSEVMKMIKEDSENPPKKIEAPENIAFPDIQKRIKGVLESAGETSSEVEKKLKYESPLEFLRVPKNKYDQRTEQ